MKCKTPALGFSTYKIYRLATAFVCCIGLLVSPFSFAAASIEDFGDSNAANLWDNLKKLDAGKQGEPIHILQLGDSHTGGDYFTGRLRNQLQARFGNAGYGLLTPGYINNQRSDNVYLNNSGKWKNFDAKQQKDTGQFPLGGFFATTPSNAVMEVKLKNPAADGKWQLSLWQKAGNTPWRLMLENGATLKLPKHGNNPNDWQLVQLELFNYQLTKVRLLAPPNSAIGGLALDRIASGITLDALGNNGSVAAVMSRWDSSTVLQQLHWRDPQLIILAYGTNEAFDPKLVLPDYEAELRRNIQRLRSFASKAAILLVGLPSSAKKNPPNTNLGCSLPAPPNYITVQHIQRRVAETEHTLYWDWSEAMGGTCAAIKWADWQPALMRPDLVHLSAEGYSLTADALYEAIISEMQKPKFLER